MHSEAFDGSRSEQPDEELGREQRQAAAEDDAGKLPLRAHLAEHESQPADHDRDQGEGTRERAGEGAFEIAGGALPRRLREREAAEVGRAQPSRRDDHARLARETAEPCDKDHAVVTSRCMGHLPR